MRFEAKHRITKIAARSSFNRCNICLILAIKHQLQLNDIFGKGNLCSNVVVGPFMSLCPIISHAIKNDLYLDLDKSLFCVSWTTIKGVRYKTRHIQKIRAVRLYFRIDKSYTFKLVHICTCTTRAVISYVVLIQ